MCSATRKPSVGGQSTGPNLVSDLPQPARAKNLSYASKISPVAIEVPCRYIRIGKNHQSALQWEFSFYCAGMAGFSS